jgi:hypothetical protein
MEKYSSSEEPPVPIVVVKVANPTTGNGKEKDGKIDTGSYMTAIPETLVSELALVPASEHETTGYKREKKNEPQKHLTYFVDIALKGYSFPYTEVLAVDRQNVLIGRDILNQLKLILDGKNLMFEIADP